MAKQNVQYQGGIGLGGLLTIVFLILKLTGTIAWSWWWIFAPIWIPFGLLLLSLCFFGVFLISAWKN